MEAAETGERSDRVRSNQVGHTTGEVVAKHVTRSLVCLINDKLGVVAEDLAVGQKSVRNPIARSSAGEVSDARDQVAHINFAGGRGLGYQVGGAAEKQDKPAIGRDRGGI